MIGIADVFEGLGTVFVIPTEEALKIAVNGGKIPAEMVFAEAVSSFEEDARYRVFLPDNRFLGIYTFQDSRFILEKMFL